jgi:hypothetical protein
MNENIFKSWYRIKTSAIYTGGTIVVTPIPIPAITLDAYNPDRFPLHRPCPRIPAI